MCVWAVIGQDVDRLCSFHIKKCTCTAENNAYFVAKSKKVCGGDGAAGQAEMVRTKVR
jgi:hypothetical protein